MYLMHFFISIANASQYGNNAIISPLSNINDGIFEVIVVEKVYKMANTNLFYLNYLMEKFIHLNM